jgi:hypothetical protein
MSRAPALRLDAKTLHDEAARATGYDNFGEPDYLEGLQCLLVSAEESAASLGPSLRAAAHELALGMLVSRLHSEAGWRDRPGCLTTPLEAPLVITGIPRTGTTALHHLLAQDEQFQVLPQWITSNPMVRPPRAQWEANPTYQAGAARRRARGAEVPEMRGIHWIDAEEPEECILVTSQSFVTNMFPSILPIHRYEEWFLLQDETASYRRYADNLRLISADEPTKTWLLKNPSHVLAMDNLLTVFPDARVIQTHRDPTVSIPSVCNLINTGRRRWGFPIDPHQIGQRELRVWSLAIERMEASRAARPASFHDVDQRALAHDPMKVVHEIYERFDLDLRPEAEAAMARWVRDDRHGAAGRANRSEEFGLTSAQIRSQFGTYMNRFREDES